jgi:hypothetical protein
MKNMSPHKQFRRGCNKRLWGESTRDLEGRRERLQARETTVARETARSTSTPGFTSTTTLHVNTGVALVVDAVASRDRPALRSTLMLEVNAAEEILLLLMSVPPIVCCNYGVLKKKPLTPS